MFLPLRHTRSALLLGLLGCIAAPAWAAEPLDTFSVRLGGYISTFDTEVRADGETSSGTEIDLDRDLGLNSDATIGYVGFAWRPWEKHEFGLSYYGDSSSVEKVLQRDIEFDGVVYETSSTVRAEFGVDAYEAYYVWWAASHENWALGPRVGLIWYRADMAIDLRIDANGQQVGSSVETRVSADLPAPTIGGSWRWSPADNWRISADAGYFSANFDDIEADIAFGRAGVEWFPWEAFGFSLDYVISNVKADADKVDFHGHLHFVDSGVRLGLVYRF